ncbi:class I SAM-dependent methyltransferase [Petroclostridium sp. X23]|uniref:class I SAM-dependent methyltransferase n=1 Tax=Petroclostridium sp. X23 TaxID=3045146 RepID=UPI0024ADBF65|nr:class I SAM-dependent methyltransferase [Petroclostridium sp. X23]WHH60953.1 class I SAM-dependent methyltransferase [Petroclostridium sp. X23]
MNNRKEIKMVLTDERVIPKLMNPKNGLLKEHIQRYKFASGFAKGKVLDIACGVGYGSHILLNGKNRELIKHIVGVDIDEDTIQYARENYAHDKAAYYKMNALSPDLVDELGQFDTIISFETVEHLEEDIIFIDNLYRLLKLNGKLIISTPFGRGRGIQCSNPFHIHQYKEEEFIELLEIFDSVKMYHQRDETIEIPIEDKKYYLMVAVCSKL